jgi:hypothetical protein
MQPTNNTLPKNLVLTGSNEYKLLQCVLFICFIKKIKKNRTSITHEDECVLFICIIKQHKINRTCITHQDEVCGLSTCVIKEDEIKRTYVTHEDGE